MEFMSDRRRICFVGNCQTVHLKRWVDYFKDKSNVYVLSSRPCNHKECLLFDNIIPARWRKFVSFPKIGFVLRSTFLYKYLRANKIDLVHIHQLGGFESRIGKSLIFLRFQPLVVTTWGKDVVGLRDDRQRVLRSYVLQKADLVTAVSNFLAKETRKIAPGIKRLEVVPFGVDLDIFDPKRFKRKEESKKILRIGFFKHLKPKYGPEYLLRAFKIVSEKFNNAELFLAGKGELKEELEGLAEELGLSRKVHFLGFVENVPEVMASMDVTAMPSVEDSETFGVAAAESQALEIPVVASRVGGVPEVLVDGKTGFLVPPKDYKALAGAMIKLLSDVNLRKEMGKSGRKFVESKYNWKDNAGEMSALYDDVLGKADV